MIRAALLTLSILLAAGCVPSAATLKHIDVEASAHDGAARLIENTIGGKLTGDQTDDNVTSADLNATPATVRNLLRRSIKLNYKSRKSWHYLRFTMGNGPDPDTLKLSTPPGLGSGDILAEPVQPTTPGGPK